MKKYGCIGKKLTHSFSKEIHSKLASYNYELIELAEDEIDSFLKKKEFAAINVTIPYKETVIPYLDYVDDKAKKIKAVNTIVNKDGKLYGYNTDYFGIKSLVLKNCIDLENKKVLILGTGGTSKTAYAVSEDMKASEILLVSRSQKNGCITYDEAIKYHFDASFIINTTPSGMYPDCESKPLEVSCFPFLEGVIDVVYNPLRTNLILDAKKRNIKAEGGLFMLVMQGAAAVEKFLGVEIEKEKSKKVFYDLFLSKENIVLTGMPGCGKTTVGKIISEFGFEFFDTDDEIEKLYNCTVKELIQREGEEYFRNAESDVIRKLSEKNGVVIATGGGAILREENVKRLKRNGKLFFLDEKLSRLCPTDDRPLSNTKEKLFKLYEERAEIYKNTADIIVKPQETPQETAKFIVSKRMELI